MTGKRTVKYRSVKVSTKAEAEVKLREFMTEVDRNSYVDPTKVTLGNFLDRWLTDWAAHNMAPKTAERFRDLVENAVKPHIGGCLLQKLRPRDLAALYTKLLVAGRKRGPGGLAPRTVGHVHRMLHRALGIAVLWGERPDNPAAAVGVTAPPVETEEMKILGEEEVRNALDRLKGHRLHLFGLIALSTGMRRGEILALRWRDIDMAANYIRTDRSLEQTRAGLRFKAPKTRAGRRSIKISGSVVAECKAALLKRQEQHLALGRGKVPEDGLVFCDLDGQPLKPNAITKAWAAAVKSLNLPKVTLHSLRHSHASQLIAGKIDVLTVSQRLGHSKPSITLDVYSHAFKKTDEEAADLFEKAFGGNLGGNS